ncbi:MAG: hypothetical protein AAGE65_06355 [Planctomycetota bacterium]
MKRIAQLSSLFVAPVVACVLMSVGCHVPEATTQVRYGGVAYVFDSGMFRPISRGPGEIDFIGPSEAADFKSRGRRLLRGGEVIGEVEPGDTVRIRPDGAIEIASIDPNDR